MSVYCFNVVVLDERCGAQEETRMAASELFDGSVSFSVYSGTTTLGQDNAILTRIIMPRNMSFAMTTEQFINREKTITRRFGWTFLKPGDLVCGVKKAMGLKKGEKIERLGMIRIISTRLEPLNSITQTDVVREGFPGWTTERFIEMLVNHYKIDASKIVNRIEFEYT